MRISWAITSRWPILSPTRSVISRIWCVVLGLADAVDGTDAGHDDHVAPLQQALGGRQAHLLDVLVDRAVLLDEQVALRHVGLGLVVVVVADEVLDRIAREELAELAVQLGGQRLVGREHDRRPAQPGDHVGHGEGLARAGHAQQGLVSSGRPGCPPPAGRWPWAGRRPARRAGSSWKGEPGKLTNSPAGVAAASASTAVNSAMRGIPERNLESGAPAGIRPPGQPTSVAHSAAPCSGPRPRC